MREWAYHYDHKLDRDLNAAKATLTEEFKIYRQGLLSEKE